MDFQLLFHTKPDLCVLFCLSYLVKELAQGFVALPLVADFCGGDSAGARADVGGTVLLTRVVQVASLGSIQTVILSGHSGLTYRHRETQGENIGKPDENTEVKMYGHL